MTRRSSVFRWLGICLPVAASAGASATRIRYLDDSLSLPAGLYANVDFATQTGGSKTFCEKVSFKLESDGWHFTGYMPRDTQ
jgi:hypothetical protein